MRFLKVMSTLPTEAYICPNHPWVRQLEEGECPIDGVELEAVPIPEINPGGTVRVPITSDEGAIQSLLEANAAGTQPAGPGYMRKDWAQRLLDQLNNGSLRSLAFGEKDASGTPVLVWGDSLITMPFTIGG
jgi:hypothetical protein